MYNRLYNHHFYQQQKNYSQHLNITINSEILVELQQKKKVAYETSAGILDSIM